MVRVPRYRNFLREQHDLARARNAQGEAKQRALLAKRIYEVACQAELGEEEQVWASVQCGCLDRAYVKFLGEAIAYLFKKPPNKARYALRELANRLARGRGRYSCHGRHRKFAAELAESVRAFAKFVPRGNVGNPDFWDAKSPIGEAVQRAYGVEPEGKGQRFEDTWSKESSSFAPDGDSEGRTKSDLLRSKRASKRRSAKRADRQFIKRWSR